MSGRAKHWYLDEDGRWILCWQTIYVEPEPVESKPDYTAELILGLSMLTDKQRFVVECRYGLRQCPAMAEHEIADLMGITQQAVSRIIDRALRSLRKGLCNSPIYESP